ncbi:ligand-binding sensor domain-containing protein [Pedobacter psychroterrae]|uniref:ligand-binding sensor domain-containing protein n=1 Tax=Pedobacter psychroterrae TaxID=2530453 RepID=UPI001981DEDA|nr:two-component regulator propeller domain-containing protein [Pedobacter psychroterrae]
MVRNVKQAKNGDILIAAFNGVVRYDGKSFTNITSKISSPSFWDVLEDRKGNLWFSSRDSGVYHYNGKSFQHFTTKDGLASNMVFSIYEDKKGNIWFGTSVGASRYDGKSFQNSKEMLVLEDKTGKLSFSTGGGARIYDGKTFTVLKNKAGKPFTNVGTIIEDKKGNILFSNVDGLWRYDGSTFTNFSKRGAYALIEDKKGNIWTTGEVIPNGDWVLSRYDQKSLYNKKPRLTEIILVQGPGMLCGILEANDGSIWFGGLGSIISGVFRYDGKTITDFKRKDGKLNYGGKEGKLYFRGKEVKL